MIGRANTIVVPPNTDNFTVAVNWDLARYKEIVGNYELAISQQLVPPVPTHTYYPGDATGHVPPSIPHWNALTSLNVFSYYRTQAVDRRGFLRSQTLHPIGAAHFSVYDSHVQ